MLPEDDRVIETCRSVLSVLMLILDLLNSIYICYLYHCTVNSVVSLINTTTNAHTYI